MKTKRTIKQIEAGSMVDHLNNPMPVLFGLDDRGTLYLLRSSGMDLKHWQRVAESPMEEIEEGAGE